MNEQPLTGAPRLDAGATHSVPPPLVPPILGTTAVAAHVGSTSAANGVWGAWATLGLGVAIVIAHVMAQTLGVIPFVLIPLMKGEPVDIHALGSNGLVIAIGTLVATPVSVALAFLFARIKAGSWRGAGLYLGLRAVPFRACIWSLLTLAGLLLCWNGYAKWLGMPDVPEVMLDMYRTAGFYPLLWAAVVVAAPVSEEVIFRGFFYAGLRQSWLGAVGAIVLPSLLWAAIHLQYGPREIGFIVFLGLALGALRYWTKSLWPPILVHALSNLLSTIEVATLVGAGG